MNCPNCGVDVTTGPRKGFDIDARGHHSGCAVSVLLGVLEDRGHDITGIDVTKADVSFLWDEYLGPATDALAGMLDLGAPYPPERTE